MLRKLLRKFSRNNYQELSYPNTSNLLWNKGLAMLCDHYDFCTCFRKEKYNNIKNKDTVWVKATQLEEFLKFALPEISEPFILLTGDSTRSLPKELSSDTFRLINESHKITHWFAQNCDLGSYNSNKISALPLGIDFHSQFEKKSWRFKEKLTPAEQELQLLTIRDKNKNIKKLTAYADFHLNNTTRKLKKRDFTIGKDRIQIYQQLKNEPSIYFQKKRLLRHKAWNEMSKFAFVISPHGSGLDCHRTWEALVLGSYVIVEKSVLDELYEGLPVKILKDFSEINADKLKEWQLDFSQRFSYENYFEKLTNKYWINKIKSLVES